MYWPVVSGHWWVREEYYYIHCCINKHDYKLHTHTLAPIYRFSLQYNVRYTACMCTLLYIENNTYNVHILYNVQCIYLYRMYNYIYNRFSCEITTLLLFNSYAPHIVHCTLYTVQCTSYTVYSVHPTPYTAHYTTVHRTLYTVYRTPYIYSYAVQCMSYSVCRTVFAL